MVERRELINVFRQIGIMMQAGVDFLRITHVLRAQTENPRLAALYNALDHDLTMGMSLADAMARQPDIFSPFAVSLVRQTEMRSDMAEMSQDLAAAFLRVADYLQQEAAPSRTHGNYNAAGNAMGAESAPAPPSAKPVGATTPAVDLTAVKPSQPLTVPRLAQEPVGESYTLAAELERWRATLRLNALRGLLVVSVLCAALATLEGSVALGWLEAKWLGAALWGVSALFAGGATCWLWQCGTRPSAASPPVIRAAPPQPAPLDNASDEVSAESHSEVLNTAPSATQFAAAATVTGDDALDEGEEDGDVEGEPDTLAHNETAPGVARGNWADLKRADRPSALPIWAREVEAAGLPPLAAGSGQIFAPPDSSAPPTSHRVTHSPEEADYD